MFNRLRRAANQFLRFSVPSSSSQPNYDSNYKLIGTTAAISLILGAVLVSKKNELAEAEADSKFQIPKMLQEREAQKQKEYRERQAIDVEQIMDGEISDKDAQELTEADKAYLFDNQSEQENPNAEEEEEEDD